MSLSFVFILWNQRQKPGWKQEFLLPVLEGGLTEELSYRGKTSSQASLLVSFSAFLTLELFLTIQEPKSERKKKGCTNPCFFYPSFQTLLAGLILLFLFLLRYFLPSFMDPRCPFTCDITKTLSYQDCVYPEQTSLIIFYLVQGARHPNPWWCLDSH